MRSLVAEAGLQERIALDSAGTGSWHLGHAPDERATAAARERGIPLSGSARQVSAEDLREFDLVLAMDASNRSDLLRLAAAPEERSKIRLLREFDPASARTGELEVPDPYYGGAAGFGEVLDLVYAACAGLLAEIEAGALP